MYVCRWFLTIGSRLLRIVVTIYLFICRFKSNYEDEAQKNIVLVLQYGSNFHCCIGIFSETADTGYSTEMGYCSISREQEYRVGDRYENRGFREERSRKVHAHY